MGELPRTVEPSRRVYWPLAAIATALLWVRPADVSFLRQGLDRGLEPGVRITRSTVRRIHQLVRSLGRAVEEPGATVREARP